jgi:4-hydroxy-tetrahydrodipicolinate synthase
MLELMTAGICGVMPGLAVSDILQVIWKRGKCGDMDAAYALFQSVLPQITFSLQSMEFYHHAEKELLVARGILPEVVVRDVTLTVAPDDKAHIDFLNRKVIASLPLLKDSCSRAE